ncbi:hypothetical protein SAMN05216350_10888 [Polaromonas sp. YR568]|uniref:hypothetical protein n=1 Tax=Polaromonas sp. YR568 TaxID=1855301 RepID=UPI0008EDA9DE|nr:hypothetical protein [Polaromonas sp. YR568]SFU91773.1 hypothetical protein SAMN05216350_10888 [Polaromonas sp. YR568]
MRNTETKSNKKVLVILPSPLMARNFLRTDILHLLGSGEDTEITVVSPNPDDRELVEKNGAAWHPYFHPRRSKVAGENGFGGRLLRVGRYARYLAGLFLHMGLTYRINTLSGFKGFSARLRQSFGLRKIYLREGLPMSRLFGLPFPKSWRLYRFLYTCYYQRWQSFGPVEKLITQVKPDLMILSMVQTHMVTPYALAAHHLKVKILGINGSWDQPTTKGPVCPGIERIAVQNDIVRDELIRYHHIAPERVKPIGWLQMDAYFHQREVAREDVLRRVGIPLTHRYILFAANAPRLGLHEPEVFKQLAIQVQANTFGTDVTLVCRCHPQDRDWRARWGSALAMERVVVDPPDLGPLDHLAAMVRHAGVVIASAGSINLDAVALDTPTIGLAWEDPDLPYWDRPARAYDLEHLRVLRTESGMMFARDLPELLAACTRYLAEQHADAEGRAQIRHRYLYRLDGGAAARLANEVKEMLE